jgi:hypothetical protein
LYKMRPAISMHTEHTADEHHCNHLGWIPTTRAAPRVDPLNAIKRPTRPVQNTANVRRRYVKKGASAVLIGPPATGFNQLSHECDTKFVAHAQP